MDEYLTSRIHHKSHERCGNLKVPIVPKVTKKPNKKNKKLKEKKITKINNYSDAHPNNKSISEFKVIKNSTNKNPSEINITKECLVRGPLDHKTRMQINEEIKVTSTLITLKNNATCRVGPKDPENLSVIKREQKITIIPRPPPSTITNNSRIQQEQYSMKKVNSVLTFKNVITEMGITHTISGCINRDLNAVINDNSIIESLLTNGTRPKVFSRTSNVQVDKRDSPESSVGNLSDPSKVLSRPSEPLLLSKLTGSPKNVKNSKKAKSKEQHILNVKK
jgi:hypothetical protein